MNNWNVIHLFNNGQLTMSTERGNKSMWIDKLKSASAFFVNTLNLSDGEDPFTNVHAITIVRNRYVDVIFKAAGNRRIGWADIDNATVEALSNEAVSAEPLPIGNRAITGKLPIRAFSKKIISAKSKQAPPSIEANEAIKTDLESRVKLVIPRLKSMNKAPKKEDGSTE